MTRHKVKMLMRTCEAFPSQWEGRMFSGEHIYIRFRTATLRVTIAASELGAVSIDPGPGHKHFLKHLTGNPWLGEMSTEHMQLLTAEFLDFSECKFKKDRVKFYIYKMTPEQISWANPSREFTTGKVMPPITVDDEPLEITADKERYTQDPHYKEHNWKEMVKDAKRKAKIKSKEL